MPMLWIIATVCIAGTDNARDVALSISDDKSVQDLVSLLASTLDQPKFAVFNLRIDHGDGTVQTPLGSQTISTVGLRMGDYLTLAQVGP